MVHSAIRDAVHPHGQGGRKNQSRLITVAALHARTPPTRPQRLSYAAKRSSGGSSAGSRCQAAIHKHIVVRTRRWARPRASLSTSVTVTMAPTK